MSKKVTHRAKNITILAAYAVLAGMILWLIFSFQREGEEKKVKIGFVTMDDASSGWSAVNYRAVKAACEKLEIELITVSDVKEYDGSCPRAVEKLVKSDVGLIILNSSAFANEMRESLYKYPGTTFYAASADFTEANLTPYSSRLYQVRYLSGIVAGMQTKTNKIGFVASVKDAGACRGINAFTLGVRRVNPDAEVVVSWTGSWDNEQLEKTAARSLIENENVDVMTYHEHKPYAVEEAENHGIYSIGYYEPIDDPSENYLTCAMCDWTSIYEKMVSDYIRGNERSDTDWVGIESGCLSLSEFSPKVSDETRAEVSRATDELIRGLHVFSGDIYDNRGVKRCSEGETLSDETLWRKMDWLVKGVREYEDYQAE